MEVVIGNMLVEKLEESIGLDGSYFWKFNSYFDFSNEVVCVVWRLIMVVEEMG
jgi:hypothetical protein